MKKPKIEPLDITLSTDIQKFVRDAILSNDEDAPTTKEEWEEFLVDVLEEYFNF